EHAAKTIVGVPKRLSVGNNEASCIIILIEVPTIDDSCCRLLLHPITQQEWLRGLITNAQLEAMGIEAHNCDGIFCTTRTFPIFITNLNARSALVPHVQCGSWCSEGGGW